MQKKEYSTLPGVVWVLILLAGILAVSCQSQPESVRIGLVIPRSGDLAETIGQKSINGAQLAVAEVNERGGLEIGGVTYRVELVIEDNKNQPETAVSAVRKLINQENVVAIVGPQISRHAVPAAGIAEAAGIPLISPASTSPETTAGKQFVFRATFLDDLQASAIVQFSREDLKAATAAVLYDVSSTYNRDLAENFKTFFERAGGTVVAFETYTSDANEDFSAQLARIYEAEPDVLYLPNFSIDVARQAAQARAAGIDAVILGSDSWDAEGLITPEFDGAFFTAHFCRHDPAAENVRAFNEKYQSIYGEDSNGLVALTYDAFGVLFAAMQEADSIDPDAIRDGLYAISYSGITGPIAYQDNGDPVKDVVIYRIGTDERTCYRTVKP